MAEENKSTIESARAWVSQNKLRAVGTLWLTGLAGSFAYNWSQPNMKTSVKIIHARQLPCLCNKGLECIGKSRESR